MPEDCRFCKIVAHEAPAHIVYEDEAVLAFLDRHPINPGHLLVVPKEHSATFYEMDHISYIHLMEVVQQLAKRVQDAFQPHKTGLIVAGWDVSHTHVHVVPMQDYNNITSKAILEGNRSNPTADELEAVAAHLT
jgi:histidine triad (HIT) family protein